MNTAAKIWTASVAYVALIIGAGLSITFNVVDVMDVRGSAVDRWDIVTAVAFPALVVLMVEMFVSRLWIGQPRAMQALRWAGTLSIGGVAMMVSWVHGHDFFLSRGQEDIVATLAPVSIDLLAIMATALILSGRGVSKVADTVAEPVANTVQDAVDGYERAMAELTRGVGDEAESWLDTLSKSRLDTTTTYAVPVVPAAVKVTRTPRNTDAIKATDAELTDLYVAWKDANVMSSTDMETLLAGWYGTSTRTIRRRISALGLRPVSGTPNHS